MLTIFKLLLLLGVFGRVFSHWMCDSVLKQCDALTFKSEYIKEGVVGWLEESTELEGMMTDTICAIVCQTQNCGAYLYIEDSVCILGTTTELQTVSEFPTRFFSMEDCTNVARDKETFYSSAFNDQLTGDRAVDGVLTGTIPQTLFSTTTSDVNGWLIVDLASKFAIKCIRIMGRQDDQAYGLLIDSSIYAGNTLVNDGDFSSYTTVVTVTTTSTRMTSWYVVTPTLKEKYRYVAVKRDISTGLLQLTEFEVYA